MTTRNALDLPHPTLSPWGTDYKPDIRFSGDPQLIRLINGSRILIPMKYELTSESLRASIASGGAIFATQTDCTATLTRETHKSDAYTHTIEIDASAYAERVYIRPYIIAAINLERFHCADWHEDLQALLPANGLTLPSGSILAIATAKHFDRNEQTQMESAVDIAPVASVLPGRFKINLDGQRIVIQVNPEDKPDIDRVRKGKLADGLWPSMYQRAIEEAVRQHLDPEHSAKRWAELIALALNKASIDASDPELLEANSLDYTQQLLENPLQRSLNAFIAVENEREEDDDGE